MPQNFVSRYNNLLAVKGRGGIEYTAGPNIDISDYIISGRDWTSDINAAIEGVKGSSFDATTAWVDSQGYLTAHQDVSDLPYVQNSALDPTLYGLFSGISGSGLYATSAENAFNAETANYALYADEAGSAASAATAEYSMSATSAYSAQYAQSANSALGSQTALISLFALSSQSAGLVTEGWDYTDPENSAISGQISGYNGSAFYDLAGDINCPWISGNKVISPTQETYAGQEFQVISSFDFSGNKNHYISLKGMVLKFPSTAHIASALGDKFDTTAFNNFITNGFNPNMNELHGATAYLSAFVNTGCVHNSALDYTEDEKISGISGIPFYGAGGTAEVPWISGNKYIGPEVLLDFGDAVQYISSFTVSGDHNHAIALKGSQFKLPSTAHIKDELDAKLYISSHSAYTAAADSRMDGIFQLANSAYTTAVNNFYSKADISAISSWSGDIEYISGQVSGLDDKYYPLTGNPSGFLTAHQDLSDYATTAQLEDKLDKTAFNSGDFYTTANESGFITGVDLSDYATTAQLETVSGEITALIPTALTGEYLTKDSADTLYYPLESNPSGYLTAHQSLEDYQTTAGMTAYLTTGDSAKFYPMTGNPSGFITAHQDLSDYANSADVTGTAQYALTTAGWTEVTGGSETGGYELSAGTYITIEDFPEDEKTVISVSGVQPAGSYQPAGRYVTYSGPYDNRQMASWSLGNGTYGSTGELFAINGNDSDGELPHILLSGTAAGSKSAYISITTAGVRIYSGDAWHTPTDVIYGKYNVIGGTNTNVSTANGSAFTVSSKDWTNTITAASAYAASMATGKEYSGVAPIVVNNSEDKISANTMELIAGDGIEFVTASTSTTINCTATGGGGASVHYYIDTPNEHTSADIELTIQTSANVGGRYDRWLMNSGNFIGALIPSADTVDDANKVLTVTAGSPRWMPLPATPSGALGIKVLAVATSAAATAGDADTLYIVTGS